MKYSQNSICTYKNIKSNNVQYSRSTLNLVSRESAGHPFMDIRFWLMDFAVFFALLGTLCLHIIYKDFAMSKGLGDYYSMALAGTGIGDLCGRMSTGLLLAMNVSLS